MDAATASVRAIINSGSRPARSGGHLPKRASRESREAHRRDGAGERAVRHRRSRLLPFHPHRRWVWLDATSIPHSTTLRIDAVETVGSRGWTKCPSRRVAPSRTFCHFSQTPSHSRQAPVAAARHSVSAAEPSHLINPRPGETHQYPDLKLCRFGGPTQHAKAHRWCG